MKTNSINRRSFLGRSTSAATALAASHLFQFAPRLRAQAAPSGNVLRIPPASKGGMLTIEPKKLEIWRGFQTDVLAINGIVPGPTIRLLRGEHLSAHVMNMLAEPLVIHWHGILAPARQDGHPRDAAPARGSYMVNFPVDQRGGTYWYHAHTDLLTGKQAYLGVAGAFIVTEEHDIHLGLPSGDHDIPLIIADKRPGTMRQLPYAPTMGEVMTGFLGTEILVNGTPNATLSVDKGLYRFRLINASNARVLKIGLSDDKPFHLIANDAGLLPKPIQVTTLMLAPGGRVETLLSFDSYALGSTVSLKTHPFTAPMGGGGHGGTAAGGMMDGPKQGMELDILKFSVDRAAALPIAMPSTLVPLEVYDPMQAKRTRTFSLGVNHLDKHQINGTSFAMERVDFTVPKGELEIWEFKDTTDEFHPMHPHGAHFQVLSRSSAATLPPEDSGWKDTVLVGPSETVRVAIKFDRHEGIFVQHCHNLEHEDDGMMQNFDVSPGAVVVPQGLSLAMERIGTAFHISWPMSAEGYQLQSKSSVDPMIQWQRVNQTPQMLGDRMMVMIEPTATAQFFRLAKL